jgi:hypothetical protein
MVGRTLTVTLLGALLMVFIAPARGNAAEFAPLDAPGPALSVPVSELDASLACSGNLAGGTRNPILLVPGTNLDPGPNFSWNYERAFNALAWRYCAVTLPRHGLGDIQISAEYVVHALRKMSAASGRKVDVLGFSQGGMLPRWALRFWPDTRALVGDMVGLAPSNHGTRATDYLCASYCPPSYHQQASTSAFTVALNSRAETFAGIDYTVAYSHSDEIVTPNFDDTGSSALHTGQGAISNVALQDICPLHVADHLAVGTYDPVAYALAIDALTHAGPADPRRIDAAVCTQPFQPGVDASTFATDYAAYASDIASAYRTSEYTPEEPPLACYVTASCAPVASGPAPAPDARARALPATSTLPQTGADAAAPLLAGAVALVVLAVRRATTSR